jgi:CRISPR-associated protein Cmr2
LPEPPRLYFTIAPVQAFVAQSRRTRDLWASSYLLSYLASAALDAVKVAGCRIVLPAEPDGEAGVFQQGPPHGNAPNRFVAEGLDLAGAAQKAAESFRTKWQRIAETVWTAFLRPVIDKGNGTRAVWDRQVNNFWEITWATGSADADPLPCRKNWRTTPATIEPGDHCSMMGHWQELSGFIRSLGRSQQDAFWEELRIKTGGLGLDADERLCAIALIKRLFPCVAKEAVDRELNAENWPSTPYLAAIPWLRQIASRDEAALGRARAYAKSVCCEAQQPLGERHTTIKSLTDLSRQKDVGDLFCLDGNFFHERALRNERVTPLEGAEAQQGEKRKLLLKELRDLCDAEKARASSFYALLLMDGDSMGDLLGRAHGLGREAQVTDALGQFARRVPSTVHDHDGITVYAGGDDLLALLAYDRALDCAAKLHDQYQECFKACGDLARRATVSGALVYCDYHLPLRTVLQSAHHLLDDMAKGAAGRDSLALGVWKSSGLIAQWGAPWSHLLKDGNVITQLKNHIGAGADEENAGGKTRFSSSFLYRLRELFASLTDSPLDKSGAFGKLEGLPHGDLYDILLAEHLRSVSHRTTPEEAERHRAEAARNIRLLLEVCFRFTRQRDGDKVSIVPHDELGFDGVRVAHFLATAGEGGES